MSRLIALPTELLRDIIRHATHAPQLFDTSYEATRQEDRLETSKMMYKSLATKRALSLTCKRFYYMIDEFLYEFIILRSYNSIPSLLERLNHRSPTARCRPGVYVRRLDIDLQINDGIQGHEAAMGMYSFWGLMPACPHLAIIIANIVEWRPLGEPVFRRSLWLSPREALLMTIATCCAQTLRRLELMGNIVPVDDDVIHFLEYPFPSLEVLRIPGASATTLEFPGMHIDWPLDISTDPRFVHSTQWPPEPMPPPNSPLLPKLHTEELVPQCLLEEQLNSLRYIVVKPLDDDSMAERLDFLRLCLLPSQASLRSFFYDVQVTEDSLDIWPLLAELPLLEELYFRRAPGAYIDGARAHAKHDHLASVTICALDSTRPFANSTLWADIAESVRIGFLPALKSVQLHGFASGYWYEEEFPKHGIEFHPYSGPLPYHSYGRLYGTRSVSSRIRESITYVFRFMELICRMRQVRRPQPPVSLPCHRTIVDLPNRLHSHPLRLACSPVRQAIHQLNLQTRGPPLVHSTPL